MRKEKVTILIPSRQAYTVFEEIIVMEQYTAKRMIQYKLPRIYMQFVLLGNNTEDSIAKFAQHYKLKSTLQYLSGDNGMENLPVHMPKVV